MLLFEFPPVKQEPTQVACAFVINSETIFKSLAYQKLTELSSPELTMTFPPKE